MLVESFEIQVLVIFYEFNKGFNQIRNRVFLIIMVFIGILGAP